MKSTMFYINVLYFQLQTVMRSYCGSDVGLGVTQLLSQALSHGCHSVLGGTVEIHIRIASDTMSTHAATEEGIYEL